mmetsp:Transcript_15052/g.33127  ORF Transcript_15052/g.33127 Transcript_15052/m.33127 type:complete len:588 (+) Transcript_15052:50-1813(+)|eukprot:CAMPEP_0204391796 /NCGR_PEP_ID=MMETSP0469-20131031/61429_1 /ASSEMBLY_ACC=CAM_ASM_000384 /TAXON_ID=2969 /ORGANISM="Oxyrrhis marina" /LENGTH=587 /DNA_ID=CAMNT_0051385757 /DNA_START=55 /DNA_END=1818 /DNA_ORIENTATION=-
MAPKAAAQEVNEDEYLDQVWLKAAEEGGLFKAACDGKIDDLTALIEAKADLNHPDARGSTALSGAVFMKKDKVVEWLLQNSADVNLQSMVVDNKRSPVFLAAANGIAHILQQLIEAKADVNAVNDNPKAETPIYGATLGQHPKCVRKLLDAKADPSISVKDGETPVFAAVSRNNGALTELLLTSKASPETSNKSYDMSALMWASGCGFMDPLSKLIAGKVDVNACRSSDSVSALQVAVAQGVTAAVKQLLGAKADPNLGAVDGTGCLHAACEAGNIDILNKLVNAKGDVNFANKTKETPILMASVRGHDAVVKALLAYKADPCGSGDCPSTPVLAACLGGHLTVINRLLESKADPKKPAEDLSTCLHVASDGGHLEAVNILIDLGLDATTANDTNETPLYLAAAKGHLDVVKKLMEHKADPEGAKGCDKTPLMAASQGGHTKLVLSLLVAKASVDGRPEAKEDKDQAPTPLYIAAINGHTAIVQQLINAKADPNAKPPAIFSAARRKNNIQVVETLAAAKADVNVAHDNGSTPLHAAAAEGNVSVFNCLIQLKADMDAQTIATDRAPAMTPTVLLTLRLAEQGSAAV